MRYCDLKQQMDAVLGDRTASHETRRLVYEFGNLLEATQETATAGVAVPRTVSHAQAFLAILEEKAEEYGTTFFQQAYLLNFVGEAMARTRYISKPIIEFLNTGLYFYGLDWIERTQRARAMEFMLSHAECLQEFSGRDSLKSLLAVAAQKFEQDKPFCIVHQYTNALRKRYWADRRQTEDACDDSVSLTTVAEVQPPRAPEVAAGPGLAETSADGRERIRMMLDIFENSLTTTQQKVYLSRHPFTGRFSGLQGSLGTDLEAMLNELEGREKATWSILAKQFEMTEKTVKREYLRALMILLAESVERVFGDRRSSNFVRRMLATLRSIVQERDLKIRDNAGRGLSQIVGRWEIALRFVLNHASKDAVLPGRRDGEFRA
ncbi:MAG: hypothetical protein V3W41_20155 [Planctomycetota bacterium]